MSVSQDLWTQAMLRYIPQANLSREGCLTLSLPEALSQIPLLLHVQGAQKHSTGHESGRR